MKQVAAMSATEEKRLARLKKLMVLDTPSEPFFDEIVKIANQICNTPISLISLIDQKRQWFKANAGLDGVKETSREIAFCSHAILEEHVLEIQDASTDPRFKNNPLVTNSPNIRFYAGAPIAMENGEKIGTLCVIDQKPHTLTHHQKQLLVQLSRIVSSALIARESNINLIQLNANKLASIVESSQDAIISIGLDGCVLTWNLGAESLFGYSADEIVGKPINCLLPDFKKNEALVFISQITNHQAINHYETERVTKSGAIVDVSVSISPIQNASGEIIGVSKIARDISIDKKIRAALAEQFERLKVTMSSIGDAVITTDKYSRIEYLNPIAEKLTGWNTEEAKGKPLLEVFNIVNEFSRAPCKNPVEICLTKNDIILLESNTVLISRDGAEYGIEDSAAPIRNEQGDIFGVVLVFHDVSAQRLLANEMNFRASHDELTGIFNRSEFERKLTSTLKHSQEQNQEHALLYLDLDEFKLVNDTAGHHVGDMLLQEVVSVIEKCMRNSDSIARLGGDEFGILLHACSAEPAMRIAQMICQRLDKYRFNYGSKRYRISASIGLVIIDSHWQNITAILQAADRACYAAKESGRNRVHLYQDADHAIEVRRGEMQWATRIEQAIEDNQFVLFCQRILPLHTNTAGCRGEILVRMRDMNGMLIPPSAFLPAAERFHMASRIDRWVLTEVFNWMQSNAHSLEHIDSLSVNLSGQSLGDSSFHQFAIELIKTSNIDCKKLCFEITETAAITNLALATRFIEAMRSYNIRFSLDDFGSGVSSFGYLKRLNVDYLKIDGQFIKDIAHDAIDQATVRCICEVAKVTGKKTIAEWVEDEPAESVLKNIQIDFSQGYYRHKPAPLKHMLDVQCTYSNQDFS